MSEPLVSCVVPVYNGAAHLGDALASILAQTHRPLEVVVVDDASTDASAEVAAAQGPLVRVVRLAENRGAGGARAAGVAAARGELIAFLDADDLWLPHKLERQLAHLTGPPRLDVSFCELENFWEPGLEAEAERWTAAGRVRGTYLMQTALARREALGSAPLDPASAHLTHARWVLALRDAGVPFGVRHETLVRRRRHAGNLTRRESGEHFDALFDLVQERIRAARRR